jgi:hypothetical protein
MAWKILSLRSFDRVAAGFAVKFASPKGLISTIPNEPEKFDSFESDSKGIIIP